MSDADLTPDQIARALAGLRRGAWTHHDVVDGREVMVDRTDDMVRLAAAIERLTVERDEARGRSDNSRQMYLDARRWLNAAEARVTRLEGALRDVLEAGFDAEDNARRIAAARAAAESRVTLLEGALRDIEGWGPMTVDDQRWRIARAALTPSPAPVPPGDAPPDASAAKG